MPSLSKAQQAAAGIAHAVEKGERPKSTLKGASKQMYKGMAGKGELKKFASTKTGDLPKHVKEGTEAVANLFGRTLLGEGGHKSGCTCGWCKNKGSFGKKAKEDEKAKEKKMDEPSEPEVSEASIQQKPYMNKTDKQRKTSQVQRGQPETVDFLQNVGGGHTLKTKIPFYKANIPIKSSIPVKEDATDVKLSKGVNLGGKAASAYHNMTSKQAMTPGWKPKAYIKAAGELSGNTKHGQMKGFKNRSAAETTTGKHIESKVPGVAAKQIMEALLG